jgi:hypothetical protein
MSVLVTLSDGSSLRGYEATPNQVRIFRSMPYATSTRFKRSTPAPASEQPLDCTRDRAIAIQPNLNMQMLFFLRGAKERNLSPSSFSLALAGTPTRVAPQPLGSRQRPSPPRRRAKTVFFSLFTRRRAPTRRAMRRRAPGHAVCARRRVCARCGHVRFVGADVGLATRGE